MVGRYEPIFSQTLSFWKLGIISFIIFRNIIIVFMVVVSFWVWSSDTLSCFMLSTRNEFFDWRPSLLHVRSLVEINSISDLLVNCRVENQSFVTSSIWARSTHWTLSFRNLHAIKFSCGVLHICKYIFDDLFFSFISCILDGLAIRVRTDFSRNNTLNNLFEIFVWRSHISGMQIHVSLNSCVGFQQGETSLNSILIWSVYLFLVFFAITEFLVHILEE
jgi:hypothetical protein